MVNWETMIGDKEENDYLVGLTIVNQYVSLVLKSEKLSYSGSGSDGVIHRIDVYSGTVRLTPLSFGGTTYHSPIAAYSFYQGTLVLSQIEGTAKADSALFYLSKTGGRAYALLFFTTDNYLENMMYYDATVAPFSSYPPLELKVQGTITAFPNLILIGGGNGNPLLYYTQPGSFVTTGSGTCATKTIYSGDCISCASSNYWSHNTCISAACPDGFMRVSGIYCGECNYQCYQCSTINLCSACNAANLLTSNRCPCLGTNYYSSGSCKATCDYGYRASYSTACLKKCPSNFLMAGNWVSSTAIADKSKITTLPTSSSVLEFSAAAKGLKLAAPTTLTASNFPTSFTMTLWVGPSAWTASTLQSIVKAFGYIYLWKVDKTIDGILYKYPAIKIGSIEPTAPSDTLIKSLALLTENVWTFIGISKQRVRVNYKDYAEIHLVSSSLRGTEIAPNPLVSAETAADFELASVLATDLKTDTAPTQIKNYIILAGDVDEVTDLPKVGTSFDGFIREFKIVNGYMGRTNLLWQKYHAHSPYWSDLLVYWRLDETAVGNVATLIDYSPAGDNQVIFSSVSDFPHFSSLPGTMPLTLYRWDEIAPCWNPVLPAQTVLPYAGSYAVYESYATDGATNIFDFSGSSQFSTGDSVQVKDGPCHEISSKAIAKKEALCTTIPCTWTTPVASLTFSALNAGKYYAFCFYSALYDKIMLVSWIYIARPPDTVEPYQKLLYLQFETSVLMQSYGGDDGYGNKILLAKSVSDILAAETDTDISKVALKGETTYSNLDFTTPTGFYSGKYFLFWRPSYSPVGYYTLISGTYIKKIDQAQVYFKKKDGLYYKEGLYYLNATNEDAKEGDTLAFFDTNTAGKCTNQKGKSYVFNNGRFPPVWFGDTDNSVKYYVSGATSFNLYMCFSCTSIGKTDFYIIQQYTINQNTLYEPDGEIDTVFPPWDNPIMWATDIVKFSIATKTAMTYTFTTAGNGLVAIEEIFPLYMYSKYTASTNTQITSLGNNAFSVPFSGYENGKEYELAINSHTFISGTSELFGRSAAANIRPFRYRFRTYDYSIKQIGPMRADLTTLAIIGENFTSFSPGISIGGSTLIYETSSLTVSFALSSSDCADLPPTGTLSSYTQTQMIITGFSFHGCSKGNLLINVAMTRKCRCISPSGCSCETVDSTKRVDDQTFLIKSTTLSKYQIGYIGCDPTCLTCTDITATSCLLCNPGGTTPFLYSWSCVSACPSDYQIILNGTAGYNGGVIQTRTCYSSCPIRTYFIQDAYGGSCQNCYSSCSKCSGPAINQCTSCLTSSTPYLWNGYCISECPTNRMDSNLACTMAYGNITGTVALDVTGTTNGLISSSIPIYLKVRETNNSEEIVTVQWRKIPADLDGTVQLINASATTNLTSIKLNPDYIEGMTIGSTIFIGVLTTVANRKNSSINGTASDIVMLTRKTSTGSGILQISPREGYTENTTFNLILVNWTLLDSTTVEVWIEYDTGRVFINQLTVNPSNLIGLGSVTFPHWGLVDQAVQKTFTVWVVALNQGERLTANTTVSLTNNYTKSISTDTLATISQASVDNDKNAIYYSSILSTVVSDPTSQKSKASSLDRSCATNADCNLHGECRLLPTTAESGMICVCNFGWSGDFCNYDNTLLSMAMNISTKLQSYLQSSIVSSSSTVSIQKIGTITALINNLGQTPELLSSAMAEKIETYVKDTATKLDWKSIATMSAEQMRNFVGSALAVYGIKNSQLTEKLRGESAINSTTSGSGLPLSRLTAEADKAFLRSNISEKLKATKAIVYNFLGKISQGLTPGSAINFTSSGFETKVGVFYTADLAVTNRTNFTYYNMNSQDVAFDIPASVFTKGPSDLRSGKIANIRMMKWSGNPHTYAKSASRVQSDVVSFSFLNSTGGEISVTGLTDPIIIKMKVPSYLLGRSDLQCSYFDETMAETITYQEYENINVNLLNLTDAEKKLNYPEWKADLYKTTPLIVKKLVTKNMTKNIGDFSTTGCQLKSIEGSLIVCQCYHLSDFAVKLANFDSITGPTVVAVPYVTVSMTRSNWAKMVGFPTCMILMGIFVLGVIGTLLIDSIKGKKNIALEDKSMSFQQPEDTTQNVSNMIPAADNTIGVADEKDQAVMRNLHSASIEDMVNIGNEEAIAGKLPESSPQDSMPAVVDPNRMEEENNGAPKKFDEQAIEEPKEMTGQERIGHTATKMGYQDSLEFQRNAMEQRSQALDQPTPFIDPLAPTRPVADAPKLRRMKKGKRTRRVRKLKPTDKGIEKEEALGIFAWILVAFYL